MSGRLGNDVSQDAVSAAAALLTDAPAPEPVAPGEPQAQPGEQPRPVREGRRDGRGRFVPASDPTPLPAPAEPAAPAEPESPSPPEIEQLRAELARQQQEVQRLRSTYHNNTEQQRQALEEARREAAELRERQQQSRVEQLQQWRQEVNALPDYDARGLPNAEKIQADRNLLLLERQEFDRQQREFQQQQEQQTQWREQTATQQADLAAKVGAWGTVEAFASGFGQQLGLPQEEIEAVMAVIKDDNLGYIFQNSPGQQVVGHVRNVVGPRLQGMLQQRAQDYKARQSQSTEQNRMAAVAEGAHQHISGMPPAAAPPAYLKFTRRGGARGGVDSVANAILNGALDEE